MNKTPQFEVPLTIEPANELRFIGPFNRPVVTIMTLGSNTDRTIVFKIKTTAPKRYCVRPNIGKIAPHRMTQVEICLQPFMYDQQEKNKHKFMVQSVLAPQDADLTDLNKLWKELEPDQLMDAKLKCVFELPSAEASSDNNAANTSGSSAANIILAPSSNTSLGESVKSEAPKTVEEQSFKMTEAVEHTEYLTVELEDLRDQNSDLRKENLRLKDQVARYRSSYPETKQMNEHYAPVLAEKQIPLFYIAIAIAAAILGLLLGKYLL